MESDNNLEQFKPYRTKAIQSFVVFFLVLFLVLSVFYFTLNKMFSDSFILNSNLRSNFELYYFVFSLCVLFIYSVVGIGIYRQVFLPLPRVLKRIQDIKYYQRNNEDEDYFTSQPDFWSVIEEEVLAVAKSVGRKQKQTVRIGKAIEQILNVFPEPITIVDYDGKISYFNRAFQKIFLTSEFEMGSSLYLYDIFREPQILSLVKEETSLNSVKKEIQIFSKNKDQKKYYLIFKTPFVTRSEDRKIDDGIKEQMIIFHDITTAKKTDIMKTDFVSNVSHELRTPIMSIKGYVQTLKEDIGDRKFDHVDKFFGIIESHVDRLNLLINDLLELSYLESEVSLEKQDVDPKSLTQKIIKQFSLDLEKGSYEVSEIYKIETLKGEGRLIEQVLINLLQNTLRYTPEKTKIEISWFENSEGVVLTYKDNGPGISEEHLDRIFERFYRIDPHRSRSRGGTGLGLSIVKHIMQRHGGTVSVNSKLGHGLEFTCTFPK